MLRKYLNMDLPNNENKSGPRISIVCALHETETEESKD